MCVISDVSGIPAQAFRDKIRALSVKVWVFSKVLKKYENRPDKKPRVMKILLHWCFCYHEYIHLEVSHLSKRVGVAYIDSVKPNPFSKDLDGYKKAKSSDDMHIYLDELDGAIDHLKEIIEDCRKREMSRNYLFMDLLFILDGEEQAQYHVRDKLGISQEVH